MEIYDFFSIDLFSKSFMFDNVMDDTFKIYVPKNSLEEFHRYVDSYSVSLITDDKETVVGVVDDVSSSDFINTTLTITKQHKLPKKFFIKIYISFIDINKKCSFKIKYL